MAEKVNKVEKPTNVKKTTKKVKITVDNTISDVVKLDSEGKDLFFESSPELFLHLPPEIYQSLSRVNAQDYMIARDQYKASLEDAKSGDEDSDEEWLQSLEQIDHTNNANNLLEVTNKRPGMHYSWQTPTKVLMMGKKGYRICKDKSVKTAYNLDGLGKHEIRRNGETELILMETTQANYEALMAAEERKRELAKATVENDLRDSIMKSGAIVRDDV